jgi:hypothetical protein
MYVPCFNRADSERRSVLQALEKRGENVVVAETRVQAVISNRKASDLFACKWLRAPATMNDEGLADAAAADPFRLPRLHP